ncbi:MAG: hypothetical protein ACYTBZ_17370, partial [Planctomycetota bacterium]
MSSKRSKKRTKGRSGGAGDESAGKSDRRAGDSGSGRWWSSRLVRFFVFPLLIVIISAVCYLNADHETFLFDSNLDQIEVPDTSLALNRYLHRFIFEFWKPGIELSRATFMLNTFLNESLGLDTYDITTFLVVNVLIHAFNSCLVYFLVGAMLRAVGADRSPSIWIPLVLAVLFAVHPMQASSVAYIVQRRGMLATLFYILG